MWHWTGTLRGQSSSGHSRQLAHDEVLAQVSGRKHPAAKLGLFIWFLDFVLFWAESHSQPWLTWSSMQTTLELPASAAIKGMHRHAWPFVYLGMVLQLRTAFTVLNRGEENKIILWDVKSQCPKMRLPFSSVSYSLSGTPGPFMDTGPQVPTHTVWLFPRKVSLPLP